VRLWDVATGGEVGLLRGHRGAVLSLAFAADGRRLVTGGADGNVRLWDADSGRGLLRYPCHRGAVSGLAFDADGRRIVSGGGQTLRYWDSATGRPLRCVGPLPGSVLALAQTADGRTLVTAEGREVSVRDAATGEPLRRMQNDGARVTCLALSPDGETAAGATLDDEAVRVWEVASGKLRRKVSRRGGGGVWSLAFGPDGQTLAAGDQAPTIRLWDVGSGGRVREVGGVGQLTLGWRVAFSPRGDLLASGDGGVIRLWELTSGGLAQQFVVHKQRVEALAFSPDGRSLATAGRERAHGGPSPVRVWDVCRGMKITEFAGHPQTVQALAFAPDGRRLASGGLDRAILVWDLDGLERARPKRAAVRLAAGEPASLWKDLGGSDAVRAYAAIDRLAGAPEQSVPLLRAGLTADARAADLTVARLLEDLDANEFAVRERAMQELEKFGPSILPDLREVLDSRPTLEVRRRLEDLLTRLHQAPVERRDWREARALAALEEMGGAEARKLLESLAKDDTLPSRARRAKAALKRLALRDAAR
jgi:WD domain, G-beta repeat